jgi:hypothetical protein
MQRAGPLDIGLGTDASPGGDFDRRHRPPSSYPLRRKARAALAFVARGRIPRLLLGIALRLTTIEAFRALRPS